MFAVDLSRDGKLAKRVDQAVSRRWAGEPRAATVVYRPDGDPTLAQGPLSGQSRDSRALQADKPTQDAWDAAEYVIALAEVDPASGAPHLGSWSEDAVLFVTAGRSSGERLRTAAELIRGAGLRLRFGVLLRTDRTDNSLGMPDPEDYSRSPAKRRSMTTLAAERTTRLLRGDPPVSSDGVCLGHCSRSGLRCSSTSWRSPACRPWCRSPRHRPAGHPGRTPGGMLLALVINPGASCGRTCSSCCSCWRSSR